MEHTYGIRLKRYVASRAQQPHKQGRDRYQHLDGHASRRWHCGWSWWLWRFYEDDGWRYSCSHERYCTSCGKIFPLEPASCPEHDQHLKPTITAREAEDGYYRKREAERDAVREAAAVATRGRRRRR